MKTGICSQKQTDLTVRAFVVCLFQVSPSALHLVVCCMYVRLSFFNLSISVPVSVRGSVSVRHRLAMTTAACLPVFLFVCFCLPLCQYTCVSLFVPASSCLSVSASATPLLLAFACAVSHGQFSLSRRLSLSAFLCLFTSDCFFVCLRLDVAVSLCWSL